MRQYKQRGKFFVSGKYFDDLKLSRGDGLSLFKDIIVLRCEHMAMDDSFEYHAISKQFREVTDGEISPTYEATWHTSDQVYPNWREIK